MKPHVLFRDGERIELFEPAARVPRDLLLASEQERVDEGSLVLEADGAVLPLDGPLPAAGTPLVLRPRDERRDNAALLYRLNRDGERVRVDELLQIRAWQTATGRDPWVLSLDEVRAAVDDWDRSRSVAASFFAEPGAREHARVALHIRGARPRPLARLGRPAA